MNYTPDNFIKLDFASGAENTMRCMICGRSEALPITDNSFGKPIWLTDSKAFKRTQTLYKPKQILKHFKDEHLQMHFK
jgi:hypothetical protein